MEWRFYQASFLSKEVWGKSSPSVIQSGDATEYLLSSSNGTPLGRLLHWKMKPQEGIVHVLIFILNKLLSIQWLMSWSWVLIGNQLLLIQDGNEPSQQMSSKIWAPQVDHLNTAKIVNWINLEENESFLENSKKSTTLTCMWVSILAPVTSSYSKLLQPFWLGLHINLVPQICH